MKSSGRKIELTSLDDLFSTEENRQEAKLEKIRDIPLSELHPFKNHPFHVRDDEAMMETADSVRQYGVLVPAIARPDPNGGYELVSGHRRHRASELAGMETMPVIVRELDDDAAVLVMVDSNLQRENILPSERAFAYKMKLEAVKHQGARTDLTSAQVGPKLTAAEKIAENSPDSKSQIKRFIRDDGAIKVSRSVKAQAIEVNKYVEEFTSKNQRSPTIKEIAERFGIEPTDVTFITESTRYPVSMDAESDEDSLSLGDKIADPGDFDDVLDKIILKDAIMKLKDRDRKIIILRYFRDRTQREVAEELGVSQVQISRLENKILKEIGKQLS